MADRDPRRAHPGHDPSMPPPKRVLGVDIRPKPEPEESPESLRGGLSPRTLLAAAMHAGKHWTPRGVAVLLIAVGAVAYFALGREKGLQRIAIAVSTSGQSYKELKSEITTLRAELAKHAQEEKLGREDMAGKIALLREQFESRTKQIQSRAEEQQRQIGMTCDLASVNNKGKPHPSWCFGEDLVTQFGPPPLGALTPLFTTQAPWQRKN